MRHFLSRADARATRSVHLCQPQRFPTGADIACKVLRVIVSRKRSLPRNHHFSCVCREQALAPVKWPWPGVIPDHAMTCLFVSFCLTANDAWDFHPPATPVRLASHPH